MAGITGGLELAIEPVPGRSGLVTADDRLGRSQAPEGFEERCEVVRDGTQDLGRQGAVGDGDSDRLLMDVESDGSDSGRIVHGPVLPVLALHWTRQASSVTHDDVSDWSNHCVFPAE